ncbi:putative terminase small subunit [Salmonella phage 41]|nr:putative terminase small subunit [Salmonella phage 41]
MCAKVTAPCSFYSNIVLACNLYREARGESDHGLMSIAFVTLNRKRQ